MISAHPNEPAAPEAPRRGFRKLRIGWSLGWGILALSLIGLWVHSARNQVRAAIWVSDSHYINAVVFLHWFEINVAKPASQPAAIFISNYAEYFHSNYVAKPTSLTSPVHRWHIGSSAPPFTPGISIRLPLWIPLVFIALVGTIIWFVRLPNLTRFSLRTLLIATALVSVTLGLIVWAVR
jgi:hypothetical protein